MLSTTSSNAVGRVFQNRPKIDYSDNSDDNNEEEDNEDTSEPTSTVSMDVDGSNSAYSATTIRKIGTTSNLGNISSDDDNHPKDGRKFGRDLSNMALSSKTRPAKNKLNASSLSVVANISLEKYSLAEVPPTNQQRSHQQSKLSFSKAPPSEQLSDQLAWSHQPLKLFPVGKPSVQSSTPLSCSSIHQPKKHLLDQITVSLDRASPACKKLRITNNSDSTSSSALVSNRTAPMPTIAYDLKRVDELRAICSHIPPDDWETSTQYNPSLVAIHRAYLEFLKSASIESLELVPGALLYLVKPVLPWFAPDQHNLQLVALIMHYLTSTEAQGYKNDASQHTSHSITSSDGFLRSSCWQLLRHSVGDEGYFTNCVKLEVCPVAHPYGKDINHVFASEHEAKDLLVKYGKFLRIVVDVTSKVHLCSKTVVKKMKIYGITNFNDYYSSNPDKFFSLTNDKYETCCHPEALLNIGFWNGNQIRFAPEWDLIFTAIRKFCGDVTECSVAGDLVKEKPGSEGHILLLLKQQEACVHAGRASHATDSGMPKGSHLMKGGEVSMPTKQRGQLGGEKSHATDPGMPKGSHVTKKGTVAMPSEDRGRKAGLQSNQKQAYATCKARGTGIPGMSSKQLSARNMGRPMNGTSHLHPNAEQIFENHCNLARWMKEVSLQMIYTTLYSIFI